MLSATAPDSQSASVFTGIFVIVWCGAGVITLNSKLLGGHVYVGNRAPAAPRRRCGPRHQRRDRARRRRGADTHRSFFQSVCVLGYCICPLVLAALVGLFVPFVIGRVVIVVAAFLWSSYGAWRRTACSGPHVVGRPR